MNLHVFINIAICTWTTSVQMQALAMYSKSSDHPVCMEIVYTLGKPNKMNCLEK